MSSVEGRVALVVPSCDKYSDLWAAFFKTLQLHWPSCPFQKYLVSNELEFFSTEIVPIRVGRDLGWSANCNNALASIPHEYVLLFIDDLFLRRNVDHRTVMGLIERCVSNEWDYLRLNPTPGPPRGHSVGGGIGRIPHGDWYRASTVLSLWKKSVLADVLNPKENAWELEIFGGARTDKYERWFACERWNLPYYNLVIKGRIEPLALSRLLAKGVQVTAGRPVMNPLEAGLFALRRARFVLVNLVPRSTRRRLRSWFAAE